MDNLIYISEKETNITNITEVKYDKLTEYFTNITEDDIQSINEEYSDKISWVSIYNINTLEFLRRFNSYISVSDMQDNSSMKWNSVTLFPVVHYLEDLVKWVYSIDFNEGDADNDELVEVWNDLIYLISMLKETRVLEKLLQIAYKDATFCYEFNPNLPIDIFQDFKTTSISRVSTLSSLLFVKVVNFQIQEYITTIEKKILCSNF